MMMDILFFHPLKIFMEQSWEYNAIQITLVYFFIYFWYSVHWSVLIRNPRGYFYAVIFNVARKILLFLYELCLKDFRLAHNLSKIIERKILHATCNEGGLVKETILAKIAHLNGMSQHKCTDEEIVVHFSPKSCASKFYNINTGRVVSDITSHNLPDYVKGIVFTKPEKNFSSACFKGNLGTETIFYWEPVESFAINSSLTTMIYITHYNVIVFDIKSKKIIDTRSFSFKPVKVNFICEDVFTVKVDVKFAEFSCIYACKLSNISEEVICFPNASDIMICKNNVFAITFPFLESIIIYSCKDLKEIDRVDSQGFAKFSEFDFKAKDYEKNRKVLFLILCARRFSPTSTFFVYEFPLEILKIVFSFCEFPNHIPKRIKSD